MTEIERIYLVDSGSHVSGFITPCSDESLDGKLDDNHRNLSGRIV